MALKAFAGGRLFGHTHGAEPPEVLALHGWGRSGADFDAVLVGTNAIALDLPGFGATPEPQRATGAHGYATMITEILDEFLAPPTVVAHSFGGRVALALEAQRPHSFAELVFTGVPLLRKEGVSSPSVGYRMFKTAHRLGLISDERMEAEKRRRGSADYRAVTGVMRDVLVTVVNESYESELAELTTPLKLVWGAEDRDVPVNIAERAIDLVPAPVELDVVEGGGHFLPLSHPERLRSALGLRQ